MAWTSPRTWTVGEVVTASLLNTHVRDNLKYLKGQAGAVSIEDQIVVTSTFGTSQYAAKASSVLSSFWSAGEPGITFDAAIYGLNWRQSGGATMARDDNSKGGSYLRLADGEIDLDIVSNAGADTRAMRLTTTGMSLGSNVTPLGRLHAQGTNGIGRWLMWDYDGLDGTARTVIPDGPGDVLYGIHGFYICRSSSGGINTGASATGTLNGGTPLTPGANSNMFNSGSDVVQFQVAANGAVTVQRTGGSLTYKVALFLQWM